MTYTCFLSISLISLSLSLSPLMLMFIGIGCIIGACSSFHLCTFGPSLLLPHTPLALALTPPPPFFSRSVTLCVRPTTSALTPSTCTFISSTMLNRSLTCLRSDVKLAFICCRANIISAPVGWLASPDGNVGASGMTSPADASFSCLFCCGVCPDGPRVSTWLPRTQSPSKPPRPSSTDKPRLAQKDSLPAKQVSWGARVPLFHP